MGTERKNQRSVAGSRRMDELEARIARLEAHPQQSEPKPEPVPQAATRGGEPPASGRPDNPDHVVEMLGRIEQALGQVLARLGKPRVERKAYTTAEFAELVDRSELTVRKWCREKRIRATKRPAGRGPDGEWAISHAEFQRYLNEGLLPAED